MFFLLMKVNFKNIIILIFSKYLCLTGNSLPLRVSFFYSVEQKDEKYRTTL